MDQVLSTLFPIHQIGSDGFNWWVGQIESNSGDDPKKSGRYKVRIVGQHLKDCDATASKDLPWANVMMPVTVPFTDGGTTGGTVNLKLGNWVVGFYLDNDKQKPIIMGSVGHTSGATLKKNVEKDPSPNSTCKSFTTFLDPSSNPYLHAPIEEKDKKGGDTSKDKTKYTKVGEAGLPAIATDTPPAAFYGLFSENTATNPTGSKVCVEIANPKCGSESDLKGGLTTILGDMLAANQQSGGQLGDYYVSKINGELTKYIDNGMEYVNKAIRLLTSFMSRVKGEIVKLIRDGVDKLVQLLLTEDVAATDDLGNKNTGPVNPDLGIKPFTPITKKQSRLKPILDSVNKVLEDLGCSIADLTDQLAQWLTDLLLGYLMDAYNAAACLVDSLVEGIINQILSLIEELLASVLGPLQELLSILADPLNIIGSAINAVFELLGISCDGPGSQCEKVTKECTDCGTDEKGDWLDDLIAQLEDGPTEAGSVCEDAQEAPPETSTSIIPIGGIQEPPDNPSDTDPEVPQEKVIIYQCSNIIAREGTTATFTILRSGNTTVSSSVSYTTVNGTATLGTDFQPVTSSSGTLGFAPGETSKQVSYLTLLDPVTSPEEGTESFTLSLSDGTIPAGHVNYYPEGQTFTCEILDYSGAPVITVPPTVPGVPPPTTPPIVPPINTSTQPVVAPPIYPDPIPALQLYSVSTKKTAYQEGETIIFNVVTSNVSNGTILNYTIDGENINSSDIVGGSLTGTFTINNNKASVSVPLAINVDFDQVEWSANETYDQDDFVYVGSNRYRIITAGTSGTEAFSGVSQESTTATEGTAVYTYVGPAIDFDETLFFSIDNTNAFTSVVILGEESTSPSYSVEADKASVDEGETITYTITTTNVDDDTTLNYTLSGVSDTDIEGQSLTGSFVIQNNQAIVEVVVAEDSTIEGAELLTFTIDDTSASEIVIINPQAETPASSPDVPTYSIQTDKFYYKESETVIYTVTTTNISDGSALQYVLFGENIDSNDITGGTLSGTFVITNNQAKFYVTLNDDMIVEKDESLRCVISGTNAFADVIILGNVNTGETDTTPKEKIILEPCYDPPTFGSAITDEKGSIISIPVIDSGCPYQQPPKIIITGAGYGASAIALLDEKGKVSEVRVTRGGIGYRKNTAFDSNLNCVIDSFTLLNPGRGYTSEPDVYVDGIAGRARARINEKGYLYSIEIIDRVTQYKELPTVTIIGGGGSGARVIASLTCLDIADLERNGYAKIGTGKYIDCP